MSWIKQRDKMRREELSRIHFRTSKAIWREFSGLCPPTVDLCAERTRPRGGGLLLEETRREATPHLPTTHTHTLSSVINPNLSTYADPVYHAGVQHASTKQPRAESRCEAFMCVWTALKRLFWSYCTVRAHAITRW